MLKVLKKILLTKVDDKFKGLLAEYYDNRLRLTQSAIEKEAILSMSSLLSLSESDRIYNKHKNDI